MNEEEIRALLESLQAGTTEPDAALQQLKSGPFREGKLGFAHIDHHRRLRQGLGEVIFGEGKPIEQILSIAREAGAGGGTAAVMADEPRPATFPGGTELTARILSPVTVTIEK